MRGLSRSFSQPSTILLSGLLVLSTHFLWAQRTLPVEKIPIRLLDTTALFARLSEAQASLHLTDGRLPLAFEHNQDSQMRFLPHCPGCYRLPINTDVAQSRTTELWGKEKYVIGTAPSKGWTFALSYVKAPYETTWRVGNLDHYVHRIPWAGSIILRISQQAKAHPHITTVLKAVHPKF